MNFQAILSQLTNAKNPMNAIMSMLNPQQKQMASSFMGKNDEQKAQQIADFCNKNNINKEQLQGLLNSFKK